MFDSLIWSITVSAIWGVLWVESVMMVVDSCMCGPPLKDSALVDSRQLIDVIIFLLV